MDDGKKLYGGIKGEEQRRDDREGIEHRRLQDPISGNPENM